MYHTSVSVLKNRLAPFTQFFTAAGDGSGANSFVGNYSVVPATLTIAPAPGVVQQVASMAVVAVGSAALASDGYGTGSALSTGVTVTLENSDGVIETLAANIVTLADWSQLCAGVEVRDFGDATFFHAVCPFVVLFGTPVALDGNRGEVLKVTLADDLSGAGLTQHQFVARGYKSTGY